MAHLEIHLFGSPQILHKGTAVEVDTRKATALLAYLAVLGTPQQRDTLAALFWPDYDQSSARAALRRTLSTLNKALDGHHLDISRDSVGFLASGDAWMDVTAFQQAVSQTRLHQHGPEAVCQYCLQPLSDAANLYKQPFMAGFSLRDSPPFEEWQFFQEETLRRELAGALERLAFGLSQSGQAEEAIAVARRWLALDPLMEEAHRMLIRLYHQSGQRNAALRQYRECERILDEELGVEPLEETRVLYEAVLHNAALFHPENRLRFVNGPAQPAAVARMQEPERHETFTRQPNTPLIGREPQLQQLLDAYEHVRQTGDGYLLAVTGEAGIGKTRLTEALHELLAERAEKTPTWADGSCYRDESGLAYAPFLEALGPLLAQPEAAALLQKVPQVYLQQVARLLPEISLLTGYTKDAQNDPALFNEGAPAAVGGSQTQFFDALRQVIAALLAGSSPGVLLLDDLHWADRASLDLLAFLARRLRGTPVLLIATWRMEASAPVETLEQLFAERSRAGFASRIALQRLDPVQLHELVQKLAPQTPGSIAEKLYQETEGLPFFAVEYLRARAQRGAETADDWEMPASVRDLLHSRLAVLDETAVQLLGAAAVIGRSFDPALLHEASGRSEIETMEGIERLLAASLIHEPPTAHNRYDFSHEKLRALVYDEISQLRRRLLHRRVAEALARPSLNLAERAGSAAFHFQQAGLPDQAAEFYVMAGDYARGLYANSAALAHYRTALALGHLDTARLHEAIADLYTLNGDYHAAQEHYSAAANICPSDCAAGLRHKLGNILQRLGNWEQAEQHYAASLAALQEEECQQGVLVYIDRSRNAYLSGDIERAERYAGYALTLARRFGGGEELAQTENILGLLAHARGEMETALAHLEASLKAAQTLTDPLAQIAALNNLARVLADSPTREMSDSLDRAIALTQQALLLCQKRGDRHHEAALHNNLADLLHQAGRNDQAMEQLKQAVTIFAEISSNTEEQAETAGQQADLPLAAIWKLTEW